MIRFVALILVWTVCMMISVFTAPTAREAMRNALLFLAVGVATAVMM